MIANSKFNFTTKAAFMSLTYFTRDWKLKHINMVTLGGVFSVHVPKTKHRQQDFIVTV